MNVQGDNSEKGRLSPKPRFAMSRQYTADMAQQLKALALLLQAPVESLVVGGSIRGSEVMQSVWAQMTSVNGSVFQPAPPTARQNVSVLEVNDLIGGETGAVYEKTFQDFFRRGGPEISSQWPVV